MQQSLKQLKPLSPTFAFQAKFQRLPIAAPDQTIEQFKALVAQSVKDGKIHPDVMTTGGPGEKVG